MNAAIDKATRSNECRSRVARAVATGLALVALTGTTGALAAKDTQQVVIREVSLAPQSAAQADRLYQRIRRAARTVCGDGDSRALREWQAERVCIADAVARAVDRIDNSKLTAAHLRATGQDATARTVALAATRTRFE